MSSWQTAACWTGMLLSAMSAVLWVPKVISGGYSDAWGWGLGPIALVVVGLAMATLVQGRWLPMWSVALLAFLCVAALVVARWVFAADLGSEWFLLTTGAVAIALAATPLR